MSIGETNQTRHAGDDLIKRNDALAAIDTFKRDFEQSWKAQFSADIKALPAVPTHSYAGESEASVYNRKGFPPIGLQGRAHAPVADSHPAIDPAAIREAALREAADVRISHWMGYEFIPTRFRDAILALIGETK
jgi:hypothetical protein